MNLLPAKFVLALLLATPVFAEAPEGYRLVWSDEFDVDGPPSDERWRHERGFVRNDELQWYQADNANCKDGVLLIEARREAVPNTRHDPESRDWRRNRKQAEYTSSSIQTSGLYEWQYGILEVRARVDARPGLWPAIWTLGRRGGWPGGGEVDVMEYYKDSILANACWAARNQRGPKWDTVIVPMDELGKDWAKEFHTWKMDWNSDRIELSVDDRVLNTIDLNEVDRTMSTRRNPFRQPHFLLLNMAVGGMNGGDPSATAFPGRYEVDYVRIYQRDDAEEDSAETLENENSGR
jgi:beta-glucanase (GH16 family)